MRHIFHTKDGLFEDLTAITAAENAVYEKLRGKYIALSELMSVRGGDAEEFANVAETLRRMEARLFFEQGQKSADSIKSFFDELRIEFSKEQSERFQELVSEINENFIFKDHE